MIVPATKPVEGIALLVAAAPLPAIDIAEFCAGVFGGADRTVASRRRQETEARDRLRALRPQLRSEDRATCLGEAELGVARSSADILGCVETSRERRRENADRSIGVRRRDAVGAPTPHGGPMTIVRLALRVAFPGLSGLALIGTVPAAAASFDQGQARSRMEAAGYANVAAVHEGNLGDWMARAVRDGHPVMIVLHPDGTVALREDQQVPPAKPVPGLPELEYGKP